MSALSPPGKFAQHLRSVRERARLTRVELALAARCSGEHLRRLEECNGTVSPELLARLLDALDASSSDCARARSLLANLLLPEGLRPLVEVSPKGTADAAASAAVEWVTMHLDASDADGEHLREHIKKVTDAV